ncbi:MAG TPA: hypothetical protein VNQ77_11755 [Frankiaceae bacterium]|nr:hypothetical protein [Frankiaceae bacterium]
MKRSLRLVLAGGLAAAALGSAAPSANAMYCAEGFEVICYVVGLPCSVIGDNPKLDDLACVPLH